MASSRDTETISDDGCAAEKAMAFAVRIPVAF
jgi:hypothetical protein